MTSRPILVLVTLNRVVVLSMMSVALFIRPVMALTPLAVWPVEVTRGFRLARIRCDSFASLRESIAVSLANMVVPRRASPRLFTSLGLVKVAVRALVE